MTEQPEPYHGEIVHTQEVRGSSPFAPTKKETDIRKDVRFLFARVRDVVATFPVFAEQNGGCLNRRGKLDLLCRCATK